jgi:Xaa-Pro aminopeptidase
MNIDTYRRRRSQLAERLRAAGGGLAIVMTAPEAMRSRDNEYPYRHDSYFHYLTGFDEPKSGLHPRSAYRKHVAVLGSAANTCSSIWKYRPWSVR